MIIDQIWQKMTADNLNNIDDIVSIKVDGPCVNGLISEYENMFLEERGGRVSVKELEDYFGARIEISKESIDGGFKIELF